MGQVTVPENYVTSLASILIGDSSMGRSALEVLTELEQSYGSGDEQDESSEA